MDDDDDDNSDVDLPSSAEKVGRSSYEMTGAITKGENSISLNDIRESEKESVSLSFEDRVSEEHRNFMMSDDDRKKQQKDFHKKQRNSITVNTKRKSQSKESKFMPRRNKSIKSPTFSRASRKSGKSDKFGGEESEYEPITSNITENIIINRSQSDWRKRKDSEVQTDTEFFFQYIFDFLGELERRINSGELSLEEILKLGKEAMGEKHGDKEG